MEPISALLWDVDGTLTDTTELISEALDHIYTTYFHRSTSDQERRALIGTPLKKQICYFGQPEQFGTNEHTVAGAFIAYYETHKHRELVLEDVIAVLREGHNQGIPTALVTSKNLIELHNTLPRLRIADFIDAAVCADDVAYPKPAPDGVLLALRMLNIDDRMRSNAIYIGDTIHDMQAAHKAGVKSIGVAWGAAGAANLSHEKPTLIVHTASELRASLFGGNS